MFNIGPLELMVLAGVALIVVGPDRLPDLAREAASMIRTLRDLATGARQQLKDELGPEFADVDLRNLNPRTAVQRAVFGDDLDLGRLNPRNALRDAIFGDEDVRAADPRRVLRESRDDADVPEALGYDDEVDAVDAGAGSLDEPVVMSKPSTPAGSAVNGSGGSVKPVSRPNGARPRPRPPAVSPWDSDAT